LTFRGGDFALGFAGATSTYATSILGNGTTVMNSQITNLSTGNSTLNIGASDNVQVRVGAVTEKINDTTYKIGDVVYNLGADKNYYWGQETAAGVTTDYIYRVAENTGSLIINSNYEATDNTLGSSLVIHNGNTLGGTGTIGMNTTINGNLEFNRVNVTDGSGGKFRTFESKINTDSLTFVGNLTFSGTTHLNVTSSCGIALNGTNNGLQFTPGAGNVAGSQIVKLNFFGNGDWALTDNPDDYVTLFTNATSAQHLSLLDYIQLGDDTALAGLGLTAGWLADAIKWDATGGRIYIEGLQFIAIPEPSTWLLLGVGAAFVAIFRRGRG